MSALYDWKIPVTLDEEAGPESPRYEPSDLEKFFKSIEGERRIHMLTKPAATALGVLNDVERLEAAGLKVESVLRAPLREWEQIKRSDLNGMPGI